MTIRWSKRENIEYKISIWTPPLSEEFVLKNINSYNKQDLIHLIKYQAHFSETFKNKLKMVLEMLE